MGSFGCLVPPDWAAVEARYQMGYRVFVMPFDIRSDREADHYIQLCTRVYEDLPRAQIYARPSVEVTDFHKDRVGSLHLHRQQFQVAEQAAVRGYILRLEEPEAIWTRDVALTHVQMNLLSLREDSKTPVMLENTRGSVPGGVGVGSLGFLLSVYDEIGTYVCLNTAAAWARGEVAVKDPEKVPLSLLREVVRMTILLPMPLEAEFGSRMEPHYPTTLDKTHGPPTEFIRKLVKYHVDCQMPCIVRGSQGDEKLEKNMRLMKEWANGDDP